MNTVRAAAFIASKLMVPETIRRWKYNGKKVTVLSLHRVSDDYSLCWPPMPPPVFDRLCRYWAKHYHVTTFRKLQTDLPVSKKPLLILSFDDGYFDFYDRAWPLLKKHGLEANMNIVTDCASGEKSIWTQRLNNALDALAEKGVTKSYVLDNGYFIRKNSTGAQLVKASKDLFNYLRFTEAGERECFIDEMIKQFKVVEKRTQMMNWDHIAKLDYEGVEIGSHTITHDVLPSIKNQEALEYEISFSKQLLENKLNHEVSVLAFPNGYYNQAALNIGTSAGFRYMLTANDSFLEGAALQVSNLVPRILLHHKGFYENKLNTENVFGKLKSYLQ